MIKKSLITIILGTRPEAIKFAPVILKLNAIKSISTRVVLTGQHIEIVSQVNELFGINAHKNLELMTNKQSLTHITSSVLGGLEREFKEHFPDLVLVQGDTSTAFSAALSAFYQKIPIGHIEAGLRTNNLQDPFPEEANRRLISQLATLHFAPTQKSAENLMKSGIVDNIFITGNTVIDSLLMIAKKGKRFELENFKIEDKKMILITVHRRENWGSKLENICKAIKEILSSFSDIVFLIPLHPNPIVREPINRILGNHPRVKLTRPLEYDELISAMKESFLILTDSGGLQEEAPALGKPVLVLRDTTERPEAVEAGTAKLIGTKIERIIKETSLLILEQDSYESMARAINPFGDGTSSEKIIKECLKFLESK